MENYIGKKVHYLGFHGGCFSAIYAKIIEIKNETDIVIENEYGRKFDIKSHWITDINRIVVPEGEQKKEQDNYLKCRCGNMRFHYIDKKMVCSECDSEYERGEFELLERTNYIPAVEKIEERILN